MSKPPSSIKLRWIGEGRKAQNPPWWFWPIALAAVAIVARYGWRF